MVRSSSCSRVLPLFKWRGTEGGHHVVRCALLPRARFLGQRWPCQQLQPALREINGKASTAGLARARIISAAFRTRVPAVAAGHAHYSALHYPGFEQTCAFFATHARARARALLPTPTAMMMAIRWPARSLAGPSRLAPTLLCEPFVVRVGAEGAFLQASFPCAPPPRCCLAQNGAEGSRQGRARLRTLRRVACVARGIGCRLCRATSSTPSVPHPHASSSPENASLSSAPTRSLRPSALSR
ncbi:hypothetical protein HPB50_015187 [Hyalomma asiaticum]|uniref:Uncharacterized protein n=1 Tax=Hyalomma asiaticum TaxID=266040 RepID=A0ACB7SM36_HYAAI|nr:hypothetical protein HPB50_015187 [Hyalomma asiaticum]